MLAIVVLRCANTIDHSYFGSGKFKFSSDSINKAGCLIVISAGQQNIKTSRLRHLHHPAFVDERPLHCRMALRLSSLHF
jgi:hypothetical protein